MSMMLKLIVACLGLLAAAVSVGCDRSAAPAAPSDPAGGRVYPYKVVTTVAMVGDLVREIAGDRATVAGLVGTGVDPHLYKASRDDVAKLQAADIVFYSGLHLEGKMTDVLVAVARTKPVHPVTAAIPQDKLLREGEIEDPHAWMDVSLWAKAAVGVGESLAAFDPANAAGYRERARAYADRLTALHEYGVKSLATVPQERRLLVTSHDAFSYFGRAYGIEVRGIQGLSTESEAGLADINALVDLLVGRKVAAVFVESSVPRKNVEALIEGAQRRGHALTVGGELFSDAMGTEGTYEGTYIGMLDHNITLVTRALGGTAPERGFQGKLAK